MPQRISRRNRRAQRTAGRVGGAAVVRAGGPLLALAATLIALGFHLGCDETRDYEMLSFFFDGVPPPEGVEPTGPQLVAGPWGIMLDPNDPLLADRRVVRGVMADTEPDVEYVYHTAYRRLNGCGGCHDLRNSYAILDSGKNLCQSCHPEYFQPEPDEWVHGPAAIGECQFCHDAHKTPYEHVLRAPQPDMCFTCHDASYIVTDPFHTTLDDQTCSNCHDPHGAGNRLLLIDARTFKRRESSMRALPSAHAAWPRDQCTQCHLEEQSHLLVENIDEQCLRCHEESAADSGDQRLHQAVADGRCTACHTPHQSTRANMIRPLAEQVCFTCHKPDELLVKNHPRVTRGDCLFCHKGHRSDRPNLLRAEITVPRFATARPDVPAAADGVIEVDGIPQDPPGQADAP